MIKHIAKVIFIITLYELSKYLTNELIVQLQAEDDVDAPDDFASPDDQFDLNTTFRRQIERDIAQAFEDAFNYKDGRDE
ncbi:transcriptional activator RinB [Staphylococcus sp. NRL 19/737]|nr:transcriptional activator RinB [Staphylococcus sp. NRL 19/737]MCJ1668553.1 transcriptional activator RinB [Staphylococcus sp. NRL 19/737]